MKTLEVSALAGQWLDGAADGQFHFECHFRPFTDDVRGGLPPLLVCVIVGRLGRSWRARDAREEVRAFITDPVLQQRLAKYLVLQCFRNSMLEDLHAGIAPPSASGNYSDVTVSSPYGAIPWPKVSRLNDDKMKRLMIDVVDRTYRFIHTLFDENTGGELLLRLARRDPLPQWNEPNLLSGDPAKPRTD
jgi:hypothetical protein